MVRKNYPFHEKDVKKMTKLVTNVMLSPFSLLNGISSTKQSSSPASFLPEGYSSNKGFRKSYVNNRSEKHNALRKGVILAKKRCNGEGSINKRKDGDGIGEQRKH